MHWANYFLPLVSKGGGTEGGKSGHGTPPSPSPLRRQGEGNGNKALFMFQIFCFAFLATLYTSAYAATLKGKVLLDGSPTENPVINMDADPVCKAFHAAEVRAPNVLVNSDHTLQNVFVYIKNGLANTTEAPKSPAVLDQKGCMYSPRVQGLQTGQPLSILNSDSTLHNVHALAKKNPEFNLGMPIQGMKLEKTFFNPEVMMKFKCDVHPWMAAYTGVLPHQFFSVTGQSGSFDISGLAPGQYVVEAWHEVYGTKSQNIKMANADETREINFNFSVSQITDEASGVSIKAGVPRLVQKAFDDSAALNVPRKQTGWWLPDSLSTYSDKIDFIFYVILAVTGIIFFGVQGILLWFILRYRSRPAAKGYYTHGNTQVEIIWTIIPAVILIILALMGQKVWAEVKMALPIDPNTVQIRIQAEQFAWNVQYSGVDGKFETPDDIRNINQLHIPVGKPVQVTLTSIEKEDKPAVIHSFFLPEFRLKQDVMPGMAIDVWFEAKKTGKYEIACAEFCGLGHYRMRGFLSIHSPEGFEAWLAEQAA